MADSRPLSELSDSGLLWLINAVVFHPRGYALALDASPSGDVTGWALLGDGSEPWSFDGPRAERLAAAEATLAAARPERFRCAHCKEPIERGARCACGRGWFVERAP